MYKSVLLLAAVAPVVFAQNAKCGGGALCPEDTPCCSAYGSCGVGAYCLGGCDPLNSFSLDACVPAPVCQSKSFDFSNGLDDIVDQSKYLGDATKADWVSQGEPLAYNGNLLLTMAQGTVGTLLASTHYVWYGKIKARFQTSAGPGVVTAFILMSDVKDEIDYEFIGVDLTTAQTNFYSQGVTNYGNGMNATGLTDTRQNFHDYEIDWSPDELIWSINGKPVRTLKKSDTWNATANRYTYPQTPSRVMLSLWPAGLETNGEGTIEWAGGLVDWSSKYMANGYFYAPFDSVSFDCYDPPSGADIQGKTSYIYTDKRATNDTVRMSNNPTIMKSLLGSGLDMDKDYPSSAGPSASQSDIAVIPGLSGAGAGANGQRGADDSSNGNTNNGDTNSNNNNNNNAGDGPSSNGFSQGNTNTNTNAAPGETALQGSFFAVVVAIVGLCMM